MAKTFPLGWQQRRTFPLDCHLSILPKTSKDYCWQELKNDNNNINNKKQQTPNTTTTTATATTNAQHQLRVVNCHHSQIPQTSLLAQTVCQYLLNIAPCATQFEPFGAGWPSSQCLLRWPVCSPALVFSAAIGSFKAGLRTAWTSTANGERVDSPEGQEAIVAGVALWRADA